MVRYHQDGDAKTWKIELIKKICGFLRERLTPQQEKLVFKSVNQKGISR